MKKLLLLTGLFVIAQSAFSVEEKFSAEKIALGKLIFNDATLSSPEGQSCASCHKAEFGHSDAGEIVSPGARQQLFGNRNAPAISYIKFNPDLFWNTEEELWMGGFFLDGREKSLQDQAGGPLLNPVEMNIASRAEAVAKIQASDYAGVFTQVYGKAIWKDVDVAFNAITESLVAYENGPEFALFNSKFDAYLQGKAELSDIEKKGLELFEDEDKGNCAACHPSNIGENGELPLLTDYSYDNLGVPVNESLPFLEMTPDINPDGKDYRDTGLAMNPHINTRDDEAGKFKVPSLRNIANTGPYMHNGVFETLDEVVEFYNSRDVDDKWAEPEVAENVNTDELGDLELSDEELKAIVAFMETFSDGYSAGHKE